MRITVGARGFRLLDAWRFPCEVLSVSAQAQTISIRFIDDGTIENDVDFDEFVPRGEELPSSPVPVQHASQGPWASIERDCSILERIASFLDHVQCIHTLSLVNTAWKRVLRSPPSWHTLRPSVSNWRKFSRVLDLELEGGRRVCDVVTRLVLSGSNVTDAQVLELVQRCRQARYIDFARCHSISFMAVYELLCIARERERDGVTPLQSLNLWLCPGVSPSYISQLQKPARDGHQRHQLEIAGPGFYFINASSYMCMELQQRSVSIAGWCPEQLNLLWLPTDQLFTLLSDPVDVDWKPLQHHAPLIKSFDASVIPLVLFDAPSSSTRSLGLPSDGLRPLLRLIHECEPPAIAQNLCDVVQRMGPTMCAPQEEDQPTKDPLEVEAERVFAMLRDTTEQLQSQVLRLERQVAVMAAAKDAAQREYQQAERELRRAAKEADRAVLCLATSSDLEPPTVSTRPPTALPLTYLPIDDQLPPLPSASTVERLAMALDSQYYAIVDGFLGHELSHRLRRDLQRLYQASQEKPTCPPSSPSPPPPAFTLGELAGGNTGRNLRYQMAHVRGDYMLWVDEQEAWCPLSVRQSLRQLDRLVLNHLASRSHELSLHSLLRKKAMATCYPGQEHAKYTRHVDNPNANGRKLTAILYLNPGWDPVLCGGELLLHLEPSSPVRVAPLMDRLLLFLSDARVPHEVLACQQRDRFAFTLWYVDYDEYMHAQVFGDRPATGIDHDGGEVAERQRIEHEIQRLARHR